MASRNLALKAVTLVALVAMALPVLLAHHLETGKKPTPAPAAVVDEAAPPSQEELQQVADGETIYNRNCAICHQLEAVGKVGTAPSIGNRDFLALASDHFIKQTVREGRPGTAMVPRRDLKTAELEAVIAYLRSLPASSPEPIQVDDDARFAGDSDRGHETFTIYCAPCHGPKGEGYAVGGSGPGIGLPGFLSVTSDDYILQTVTHGRAGTSMRPFIGPRGLANLTESDVHDVIAHLRSLDAATSADAVVDGEASFNRNCAMCHQPGGSGRVGLAPSIGNGDFLALASDEFIVKTVRTGRVGTAMAARKDLTDRELSAIISYLRSQSSSKLEPIPVDESIRFTGDAAKGREDFTANCSPCHGPNGEGYLRGGTGPGIGLPGFLNTVSDDYIFQTVKHGRAGTPMRPFIGSRGLANLQEQDVRDVIVFLRSRSM